MKCWLCGANGAGEHLDMHHIFGGAYKTKSEKYGLLVPLCHETCHIFGRYAVHHNAETMRCLRQWGQDKVMRDQGWTTEDFIREFGKNYFD